MKKVLTFGEILWRLSPEMGQKWLQEGKTSIFIGGAELNAARALARWKIPVAYCSSLPDNALMRETDEFLQSEGIDTSKLQYGGDRIGIYILPQGADLKNAGVIYDRANSSFGNLKPGELPLEEILNGVFWLHLSAISPGLTQDVADVCLELVKAAAEKGIFVSLDLNYRAKLWKYGKEPSEIMPAIASHCDLIMGNIWAANKLLNIPIDADVSQNRATKEEYISHSEETSRSILQKFPKCTYVANTFRFDAPPNGVSYYTTLFHENNTVVSPHFEVKDVADRVGSGDCFMAGLIYGISTGLSLQKTIDFASTAAVGKLHEYGDATQQTVEDILKSKP
jgi:2-dehydro-3-deoxygluconokinase